MRLIKGKQIKNIFVALYTKVTLNIDDDEINIDEYSNSDFRAILDHKIIDDSEYTLYIASASNTILIYIRTI